MITVTSENFVQTIQQSSKPVVLDVWADWCPPCHMMEPIIEQIDKELGDQLVVAKLNADEQPELTQQLGVMSLPTFVMFKDGKVVDGSIGAKPKAALVAELTQHLGVKAA